MSTNFEADPAVVVELRPDGVEPVLPEPQPVGPAPVETPPYVAALATAPAPQYAPEYAPAYASAPVYAPTFDPALLAPARVARKRPGWLGSAAIAVVGLIAAGSLGYLFYTSNQKLDATRHELFVTQQNLDATTKNLTEAQARAAYLKLYTSDLGRISADWSNANGCDTFSTCRSTAQTLLDDTQAFQSDRQSAKVPAEYANADSSLGDGLSAIIAAVRDLQTALTSRDSNRIQDAYQALNNAMLQVFKTQSELGRLVH